MESLKQTKVLAQKERSRRWYELNKDKHREQVIQWRKQNPEKRREIVKRWALENSDKVRAIAKRCRLNNLDKIAYRNHKSHAKTRRIAFLFTFKEWIAWWGEDFDKRGLTGGSLCMCRYNDEGPYTLDNVYKGTRAENSAGPRHDS